MEILESRRLTGPNLLHDREGAVLDVALAPEESEAAIAAWESHARRLLDAVGWNAEAPVVRRFPGGASLAITAPFDALYAATELNEQAWAAAVAGLAGQTVPDLDETAARLRDAIVRESNPALRALHDAADAHGVAFLIDEDQVSVGLGRGSLTFSTDAPPDPSSIDWSRVHDIPVVLVTGTNGKSTTVRLLASIVRTAGLTAGTTSTDRVEVGDDVIERGDFSGPGGARTLLRDRRVEIAILETARGGILRRGLAVRSAGVALVTNIAEDHLGDYGVQDLDSLTEAKLVITRAVPPGGRVVLNADDPRLTASAGGIAAPVTWFSLDPESERVAAGREASLLEGEDLVLRRGSQRWRIARVQDVPITFGGAARYNVANALAAIAVAAALDLPAVAMAAGLRRFRPTPEENPGRANLLEIGGVHVLVDYAHNPHGLAALLDLAATLPAERRLIAIGQAGDREEAAIRDLARVAWTFRPDRVVIKEIPTMLRGRAPGEIPALLEDELRRQGAPPESLERAEDDLEATRQALAWARPGDLLVLLIHTQRDEVLDLLRRLREG